MCKTLNIWVYHTYIWYCCISFITQILPIQKGPNLWETHCIKEKNAWWNISYLFPSNVLTPPPPPQRTPYVLCMNFATDLFRIWVRNKPEFTAVLFYPGCFTCDSPSGILVCIAPLLSILYFTPSDDNTRQDSWPRTSIIYTIIPRESVWFGAVGAGITCTWTGTQCHTDFREAHQLGTEVPSETSVIKGWTWKQGVSCSDTAKLATQSGRYILQR